MTASLPQGVYTDVCRHVTEDEMYQTAKATEWWSLTYLDFRLSAVQQSMEQTRRKGVAVYKEVARRSRPRIRNQKIPFDSLLWRPTSFSDKKQHFLHIRSVKTYPMIPQSNLMIICRVRWMHVALRTVQRAWYLLSLSWDSCHLEGEQVMSQKHWMTFSPLCISIIEHSGSDLFLLLL